MTGPIVVVILLVACFAFFVCGYMIAVHRTAHLIARMTADEQRALFDRAARLRR